jgi:hypothetical protein
MIGEIIKRVAYTGATTLINRPRILFASKSPARQRLGGRKIVPAAT